MSNKHTLSLLALAAIFSLTLDTTPAFAATPGSWTGTAGFGAFDIVVDGSGTSITQITYHWSDFSCGGVTLNGGQTIGGAWPITNNSFTITVFLDISENEEISISGTFTSASQASGTWQADFYGEICNGNWSTPGGGSEPPPVANGDFVINSYISGSWYNADQNGHGLSIEVIDEHTVLIYWYMYAPNGHSMFLLGVGSIEGNVVTADTYAYQGMIWGEFNPADLEEIYWGELTIEFHDCEHATLSWSSVVTYGETPFGDGSISLTRLLSIHNMQCNNNRFAGIYESTFRSDQSGDLHIGTTLLASDGSYVTFSYQDFVSFGTYEVSGQNFEASGTAITAVPDVYFASGDSAMGQIEAGNRLNYSYDINGGDSGTGNGWSANALYRRGISFSDISGNWNTQSLTEGETGSANINSQGRVTGSDDLGCTYSGQINIPDTRFNMIEVTVTISNCGDSNGTYTGLGYRTDAFDLGDGGVLRVFVGNGVGASAVDLWR